jgi:hypothetical protein
VVLRADVVVVGGGPGGVCAAVAAARNGANTVLVERYGALGGMASFGEVSPFMSNHACGKYLTKGVFNEWCTRMRKYLESEIKQQHFDESYMDFFSRIVDKNVTMLVLEELCLESGVKLLYHHNLCDVIMEQGRIKAAVFSSKSGFAAVEGKVFIDSTGDGDLAVLSGCEAMTGNSEGLCQPMTTCFKLANLKFPYDSIRTPEFAQLYQARHKDAQERGELSCVRENLLTFPTMYKDTVHFNTTRVCGHDATNGLELSEAEIIGRKQVREYLKWMRNDLPGFEDAELTNMGDIGVRESRRVLGNYYLTADELANCCKFSDAIARCNYPVDIHNPRGTGTVIKVIPPGDFYEVPYGCIVPQKVGNLTVGGRSISADIAAHSSLRIMPTVCSIGQAAGLAAAMAVKNNTLPGKLDGKFVREELKKFGAKL